MIGLKFRRNMLVLWSVTVSWTALSMNLSSCYSSQTSVVWTCTVPGSVLSEVFWDSVEVLKYWRQDGWSQLRMVYMSISTGRTSPVLFSFTHSSLSLPGSTFCSSWSTGSTIYRHINRHVIPQNISVCSVYLLLLPQVRYAAQKGWWWLVRPICWFRVRVVKHKENS